MAQLSIKEKPTINGRYRLLNKLGEGGMGAVFIAEDRLHNQDIALKQVFVNSTGTSTDPEWDMQRRVLLAQEFQTLASLRHPHIISVLDYGFDESRQPFFTMDLLLGADTLLDAGSRKPLEQKFDLIIQVLQALEYLHRRGILHLDLKPANVLVLNEQVRLLDFGLATAKKDKKNSLGGTPGYIAPEIIQGDTPTEAADLYAVGVMAYELLTGRPMYQARTPAELLYETVYTEPDFSLLDRMNTVGEISTTEVAKTVIIPEKTVQLDMEVFSDNNEELAVSKPNQPGGISSVIRKLLIKHPNFRYREASEVIHDLTLVMGQPLPTETTVIRESFLQAARFIGRDKELARLTEILDKFLRSRGSAWFISGESGVGKSRLLQELRIQALVRGALVMRGEASQTGASYHVWRNPIRRLVLNSAINETDASVLQAVVPDIADLLGRPVTPAAEIEPADAQKRFFAVVTSLLQRQTQPIVLILEDLHQLRSESLDLLQHLMNNIGKMRVLIIGSFRDDENSEAVKSLPADHVIKLNRLAETAVVELSESILGTVAHEPHVIRFLQQQAEGNVFFLVEVVRALAEEAGELRRIGGMELPKSVLAGGIQQVLLRRLGRVEPTDYPLLKVAAALGRELSVRVLNAAESPALVEAWLYRCASASVLEVQDENWRFTHDKLREVIVNQFESDEIPVIHRKAAQAIETAYPNTVEHAMALTNHWHMAGDKVRELHYALQAAYQAYRTSNNPGAIEYFKRALALIDELKPTDSNIQRIRVSIDLSKAYSRLSMYKQANELLLDSLRAARDLQQRPLAAEVLCTLGRVAVAQGEYVDAGKYLDESLTDFRGLSDQRGIADALVALGRVQLYQGEPADAEKYLQESLGLFRGLADDTGQADALSSLGSLQAFQGDFKQADIYLEEGLALYRKLDNRNGVAGTLMNLGMLAHYQDNFDEAIRRYTESLTSFREIGDISGVAAVLNNLGYLSLISKDYVQARQYFEDSLSISRDLQDHWGTANTLTNLGHVELEAGEEQQAAQHYRKALQQAHEIGAIPLILEILTGIARLRIKSNEPAAALELLVLPMHHPATSAESKATSETLIDELKEKLSDEQVAKSLAEAQTDDLDKKLKQVISELI